MIEKKSLIKELWAMWEEQIPAEGVEQWLKWRVELRFMPWNGWLYHREGASAWQAAAHCVCSASSGWPLAIPHLLRFFYVPHRSQEAVREREGGERQRERGWIHPKRQVLNKWMWQGERVEDWKEMVCLCKLFTHVWHIKRLHTHLQKIIHTQLYGLGRVRAVGQLLHGKGYPPICPLS